MAWCRGVRALPTIDGKRSLPRIALPFNPATHLSSSRSARRLTPVARHDWPRDGTRPLVALASALVLAVSACRAPVDALGASDSERARNADQLFAALGARFTQVHRAPHFLAARRRIAKGVLSPSTIFGDTSIWVTRSDSMAVFTAFARLRPAGYLMQEHSPVPAIVALADARHLLALHKLAGGDWEWDAHVDFSIGTVTSAQFAEMFAHLLASPAGRSEAELRTEIATWSPHASVALGRLFEIDTLRALPLPDGSHAVTFGARVHPERLKAASPALAAFFERHIGNSRYHFVLTDATGATWFWADGRKNYVQFRWHVRDGRLAPSEGAPRPIPDHLTMTTEVFIKAGMFGVGVTDLVADFTIVHSATEHGWDLHFRRPPKWQLPIGVAKMVNASLKRPFEGDGTSFRIVVRDNPGAPTTISRATRGFVRESAIVRWIGYLGGNIMGDYSGLSEEQEAKFFSEAFGSVKQDAAARYTLGH